MIQPDYSKITEAPGLQATAEQLGRIYHRYHFAKEYCKGKDVVEVACGSGLGLGYLSKFAKSVIGGDIDDRNLLVAREKFSDNSSVRIVKMDAQNIELPDNCCDVVLLYEAIYYLGESEKFIEESFRILRSGGVIIICSVNREWKDFHPSPFTHHYFSINELSGLVKKELKHQCYHY
jgi:ubiquinone/menaquinone biosynthesis C-methylase UbiE